MTGHCAARDQSAIPNGWDWARLGDICSDSVVTVDVKREPDKEFLYVDISSVNSAEKRISAPRSLLGRNAPSRARQRIRAGDVLVATTRPNLNAVALVTEEFDGAVCSTGFCVLRPADATIGRLVFAFVQSPPFLARVSALVQGALYPAVTDADVKATLMPLPTSGDLQAAVATKLEGYMAAVARLRLAAQRQLVAANPIVQSARSHILLPLWHNTNYRQNLGDIILSCQYGSSVKSNSDGRGIPMLRMINLQDGEIDYREMVHVDLPEQEALKYRLDSGDVLINRTNSPDLVGKAALFTREDHFVFASYLIRIRFDPTKCLSSYALEFINSPLGRSYINVVKRQSISQANINSQEIRRMPIPVPPIDVQRECVATIEAARKLAKSLQNAASDQLDAANALQGALLNKVFGGLERPSSSVADQSVTAIQA